jgi:hypothetical protein
MVPVSIFLLGYQSLHCKNGKVTNNLEVKIRVEMSENFD